MCVRSFLGKTPVSGVDAGRRSTGALHRADERALAGLSPFEVKARLLELAEDSARRNHTRLLDAGRGNPNWVATTPRAAFFLLGEFALAESRRVWEEPDLGGMPERHGIADRFTVFVAERADRDGASLLSGALVYGESLSFDPDDFVYELTDGILGDHYPGPDRIGVHVEQILREYLADALPAGPPLEHR